jgi:small subunit ribosomal protein S16
LAARVVTGDLVSLFKFVEEDRRTPVGGGYRSDRMRTDQIKEVSEMATKIRLRRMGAKKAPFYRVVVADSRSPRDGRFIEEIGYYDPTKEPAVIKIDEERAKYWVGTGAQPSETVRFLLAKAGVTAK